MKQSIIFLHGLFGGLSNWEASVVYFEKDYNIFVPALPLYDDQGQNILEYFVEFLDREIETRHLENLILIGNSLGGHIAVLYANRYPEKVKKLVLTGSSGLYENLLIGRFPRRRDRKYVRKQVENVFYQAKTATERLVDEVFQILQDSRKCFRIIKVAKTTQRQHVRAILRNIHQPVLLIWGENDNVTPLNVAKEVEQLLHTTTLILFKECGHAAMMEQPEKFNETIETFLLNK